MLHRSLFFLLSISMLFTQAAESKPAPVFSVAKYDHKRDAVEDLAGTIEAATAANKRILILAGGDWCAYCFIIDRIFKSDSNLAKILGENFLIMKANYSEDNYNTPFFEMFPDFDEFPHFFVLDSEGKLLKSTNPESFRRPLGYDRTALAAYFEGFLKEPLPNGK